MGRLRFLRNQAKLLAELHCLCPSFRAEFIKQPAGMRLDGVLADEKLLRNFPVAHTVCDQLKYLQFAACNTELPQSSFIQGKGRRGCNHNLLENDDFLFFGEFEPQPDSQAGKQQCN